MVADKCTGKGVNSRAGEEEKDEVEKGMQNRCTRNKKCRRSGHRRPCSLTACCAASVATRRGVSASDGTGV
jgi:hypothetical protein